MAVVLEIPDGDPHWYLSPNVWAVPGSDPTGPEGAPVAGQSCFLWARVTNTGSTGVSNATVRFYWANPSVGFDRNSANLVGISYVNLNPGETAEVLCLAPWIPEYVNDGHECILAEAYHDSQDPLPATAAFNVPTDRHVAQRNLSVVRIASKSFSFAFMIVNTQRNARKFVVRVRQTGLSKFKDIRKFLGKGFVIPEKEGKLVRSAFVDRLCPDKNDLDSGKKEITVKVEGNARVGKTLVGEIEGPAALIHIEQLVDDTLVGGLAVLVLAGREQEEEEKAQKKRGAK